jgi:hypothetical protein
LTTGGSYAAQGILTVTNHGSSPISYQMPWFVGFEVRDEKSVLSAEQEAFVTPPSGGCDFCIHNPITIAPGMSATLGVGDTGNPGWQLDVPIDPSQVGVLGAPTQPAPPGVYHYSLKLLDGGVTNAATITVCAPIATPNTRVVVCNAPCDPSATSCGAALACGS